MGHRRKGGDQKNATAQLRARRREAKILDLRTKGRTFLQIANELDMSESAACEAYHRVLRSIPEHSLHEHRTAQLERLDQIRDAAWRRFKSKGALAALDILLRTEQRSSQLLGLDAAQRFDLTNSGAPDREAQAALIARNLSIGEQRELVRLLTKARDGDPSLPPPPAPAAPASDMESPPFAPPSANAMSITMPESPGSYEEFCRKLQLDTLDPVSRQVWEMRWAEYRKQMN